MKLSKELARYLGLGAEIAASLVVPIGIGYWVDQYFNSSPFGVLFGAGIGMIIFFVLILKIAQNYEINSKNEN